MKRLSVLVFLSFLVLVFTANSNAQTATTPSSLKQQLRETVMQKKQDLQVLRNEFKTRLQTIKDARKQSLVDRLDTKLDTVNKKHTQRFLEVLAKLQAYVDKMSLTATDTKTLADIKAALTAIDAAKTAVETQAAKSYIIEITTEANLRVNVAATVSQLRKDLMQVHKLVVAAKQATQKLRTDKVIIRKEATGSAGL